MLAMREDVANCISGRTESETETTRGDDHGVSDVVGKHSVRYHNFRQLWLVLGVFS